MNDIQRLIDAYVQGTITPAELATLEARLAEEADLRVYFLRFCQLHTDLHLHVKSAAAVDRALSRIQFPDPPKTRRWWPTVLASIACALLLSWFIWPKTVENVPTPPDDIAWLVNAQNCEWADRRPLEEGLHPGTALDLTRGLAEIRFRSGATVILSGPAKIELLSVNGAKLLQGKVAARVPESAIGFELQTPQGKVIDLGTEFGVAVGDSGTADVFVFEGQVDTYSPNGQKLNLRQDQGATLQGGKATRQDDQQQAAAKITRKIEPIPEFIPRRWHWEFREAKPSSILDRNGHGIGLTHRLPGTGERYGGRDPNLFIDQDNGLELTTTDSDINGQKGLPTGEYMGIRLEQLGFTGKEDFEIVAEIPSIPALKQVGQFGLYAGTKSTRNIRGGLIAQASGDYKQFLVNNSRWFDHDASFMGLSSIGDDLKVILRRSAGKYSLTVDNQTNGNSYTLSIKHPDFLDHETDLHVGIFGANTRSNDPKTLFIRSVSVTVWVVNK